MISAPSSILEQCLYSSADFEGTSFHSSDTEFDDIFIDPNWTKQDDTILIAEKVTGETKKGPSKECNVLPRNTNKGRILNLFKIRSKLNPFQFVTIQISRYGLYWNHKPWINSGMYTQGENAKFIRIKIYRYV